MEGNDPTSLSHGATAQRKAATAADDDGRLYGFLLLDGFDLLSFAAAVQVLKAANAVSGQTLYRWQVVGRTGQPAESGAGIGIPVEVIAGESVRFDSLVVCCAGDAVHEEDANLFAWLRRARRFGADLGGIDCGAWVLARAGLLEDRRAVIHWPYGTAFRETFGRTGDEVEPYCIDRDCFTSAAGVAALQLMLERIGREQDTALADAVAREQNFSIEALQLNASGRRLAQRLNVRHARLAACLDAMEDNLDDPLPIIELAGLADISVRQLERLFAEHFGATPGAFYRDLRLEHARRLLMQTSIPVTEVAMATGFTSVSHFARAFRRSHGRSPSELRNKRRTKTDGALLAHLA